jgi:glyoxylase-like metal-dependent hydrolase (beta-lactamase superfamily II)
MSPRQFIGLCSPIQRYSALTLCLLLLLSLAPRAGAELPDAPLPELTVTQVGEHVYSAIGATAAPSVENLGHNNNLSFIVTDEGVVVVNGGDNAYLAAALHAAIRRITAAPVIAVILENGQGHAFLGGAYWADQGVPVYAHVDAVKEIEAHGEAVLQRMRERMGELAAGTRVVVPEPLEDFERFVYGDTVIEVRRFGTAHSPGDISVWVPEKRVVIAGDIAFHERLLGIFPDSDVDGWIESFDALAALEPAVVVPGHGGPTDIDTVRYYTQGYLQYLRGEIETILDEGGDLNDAYAIDQSAYSHLDTFDELAQKNVGRLYRQMEMALW